MAFDYPNLLNRLLNRPLLATPEKARVILGVLAPRAGLAGVLVDGAQPPAALEALAPARLEGPRPERRRFAMVGDVAVIPVVGSLVAKGGLDPYSGMTGYDGVRVKYREAMADPAVAGVLLDIDSPGGEAHSSLEELAADMAALKGTKPVWAMASDVAYSAAYWIAAQADRVFAPIGGGVGSVGAVALHADLSGALAQDGIKVTLLRAGAQKAVPNQLEPLAEDVRAVWQGELEGLRRRFAAAVAAGRGLAIEAVLATEARGLTAEEAKRLGFIDEIMAPGEVVSAFLAHVAEPGRARFTGAAAAAQQPERNRMKTPEQAAAAGTAPAAPAAPAAAATPPSPAAAAADPANAVRAEAARIVDLCAVAGRPELAARYIAGGIPVEEVSRALTSAKAAAAEATVIATTHGAGGSAAARIDHGAIYARMNGTKR